MPVDLDEARERAFEVLCRQFRESVALQPVDALPSPVYGFDPNGWFLFAVMDRRSPGIGGAEHIAVDKWSGEVRSLGLLGQ